MYPIQQANRPIIQVELLMMEIVHFGFIPEEIIPTVHGRRIEQLKRQKGPKGQHMATHNLRRDGDRKRVGEDLFDRMGELSRQRDRRRKLVVFLVNAHVEVGDVEEWVTVVEEGFAKKETQGYISKELADRWESWLDSVGG